MDCFIRKLIKKALKWAHMGLVKIDDFWISNMTISASNPSFKKRYCTSVQRRATKISPSIKNLSYENRLECLNLITLQTRRLIEKGVDKVEWVSPGVPKLFVWRNPLDFKKIFRVTRTKKTALGVGCFFDLKKYVKEVVCLFIYT